MTILALDLGQSVGWVVNKGVPYFSGTERIVGHNISCRFGRLYTFIQQLIKELDVTYVVIEQPFCRGLAATRSGWGLAAVAEAAAANAGATSLLMPVSVVKQTLTGNGRASKEDIIKATKEAGFNPATEHEADAIAVLLAYQQDTRNASATGVLPKRSKK